MDYMSALLSTKRGNDYVFWLLIIFPRWRFWLPARRTSPQRPLPRSYLNASRYTLGSHKPLSQIGAVSSLAHSGQAFGHYWIPSSPNPLPSTPRQMAKLRSSIERSYISCTCTIPSTLTHGMRVSPMSSIATTEPCIAQLATTPFRWGWDSNH
jgi:hypothetical protein